MIIGYRIEQVIPVSMARRYYHSQLRAQVGTWQSNMILGLIENLLEFTNCNKAKVLRYVRGLAYNNL